MVPADHDGVDELLKQLEQMKLIASPTEAKIIEALLAYMEITNARFDVVIDILKQKDVTEKV